MASPRCDYRVNFCVSLRKRLIFVDLKYCWRNIFVPLKMRFGVKWLRVKEGSEQKRKVFLFCFVF